MLLKNAQEIKNNLSTVQKNINFDTWKTYIRTAEIQYIIPYISKAQYDILNTNHTQEPSALTPIQTELMSYIQPCLAHYVLYSIIPYLNISISENGIVQNANQDYNTARQGDVKDARRESINTADMLLEETIKFLEANKADFTPWANSSAYTISKELFINSAEELQKYIPVINYSRRAYLRIRPEIANAEKIYIAQILGEPLFNELKSQISTNTITANNQKVLDMVKPCVAHFAMYEALPTISAVITPEGVLAFPSYQMTVKEMDLENDKIKYIRKKYEENADIYKEQLKSFLDKNADTYPLYKSETAIYTPIPTEEEVEEMEIDNENFKSFMV